MRTTQRTVRAVAPAITGGDDRSAAETAAALSPRDAKLLADAVPAKKRDLLTAANTDETADEATTTGEADATGEADETGEATATGEADETGEVTATGEADETGEATAAGEADATGEATATGEADATGEAAAAGEADATGEAAAADEADTTGEAGFARYGDTVEVKDPDSAKKELSPEEKAKRARADAAYKRMYPPEKLEKAEKDLTEAIPEWKTLDPQIRRYLQHMAIDTDVKNITGNKALMAAVKSKDYAGIVQALKDSEGFLSDEKRDIYIKTFGRHVPASKSDPSAKTDDKDEQAKRKAEYLRNYPLEKRKKLANDLKQKVPNWDKMNTRTRIILTHMAIDVGVENVVGNTSLMTAATNSNPIGMIQALKGSKDFLTDGKRDWYIGHIRQDIPATQAGDKKQWAASLSKTISNWDKLDAEIQDILTGLAGRVGAGMVASDEALAKSLAEGNWHNVAERVKALDAINPHKVENPVGQRMQALADKRKAEKAMTSRQGSTGAYMVQRGDHIKKVADAYGVTVQAIIDANGEVVDKNGELYFDRVITIPSPTNNPDLPGDLMREGLSFEERTAEALIKHEEPRMTSYWDREGTDEETLKKRKKTVGVGFNMDRNNARKVWRKVLGKEDDTHFNEVYAGTRALTETEVQKLLEYDIEAHTDRAREWFPDLDERPEIERIAIVNMIYMNVGHPGWPDTHEALKNRDYDGVVEGLRDSETYEQGGTRIRQIINIFKGLAEQQKKGQQRHDQQSKQP
jgi:LysM repeat protein